MPKFVDDIDPWSLITFQDKINFAFVVFFLQRRALITHWGKLKCKDNAIISICNKNSYSTVAQTVLGQVFEIQIFLKNAFTSIKTPVHSNTHFTRGQMFYFVLWLPRSKGLFYMASDKIGISRDNGRALIAIAKDESTKKVFVPYDDLSKEWK